MPIAWGPASVVILRELPKNRLSRSGGTGLMPCVLMYVVTTPTPAVGQYAVINHPFTPSKEVLESCGSLPHCLSTIPSHQTT